MLVRAALLALALPTVAAAQQPPVCMPTEVMASTLAERFDEYPVGTGVITDTHLLVMFVARDGSTWTLTTMSADGTTCVIRAGQDWMAHALPPEGEQG